MDLSQIKKNIESGVIRTTPEFQRDMMLMFTNAIMYNNCNHRVHKMAVEMYNDVLQHIEVCISVLPTEADPGILKLGGLVEFLGFGNCFNALLHAVRVENEIHI